MFKKKNAIWWILFLVFICYMFSEIYKPTPIDWSMNYNTNKKSPYGLFIFSHELAHAFPKAKTQITEENVYNLLNNDTTKTSNELLILIGNINLSEVDQKSLFKYIANGNHLLISSELSNYQILDTFGLEEDRHEVYNDTNKNRIYLTSLPKDTFFEQSRFANTYYRKDTSAKFISSFTKIGILEDDTSLPNIIRLKLGKGDITISAIPFTFTNNYLLMGKNVNYINGVLSSLSDNITKVTISNYYNITTEDKDVPQTPLRYILSKKSLKICLYIALGLVICLIIFNSKRKQRVIPIVKPPENESLKFAKNVAMLYYTQKDNGNLISKRLKYLLEHIRNTYYLETNYLDKEFEAKLAVKSNVNSGIIEQIFAFKDAENYKYSDEQLIQFIKLIELFHKEESFYGK